MRRDDATRSHGIPEIEWVGGSDDFGYPLRSFHGAVANDESKNDSSARQSKKVEATPDPELLQMPTKPEGDTVVSGAAAVSSGNKIRKYASREPGPAIRKKGTRIEVELAVMVMVARGHVEFSLHKRVWESTDAPQSSCTG